MDNETTTRPDSGFGSCEPEHSPGDLKAEDILASLTNALPQHVFVKRTNGAFVSANDAFASELGLKPEDLIGKNDFDLFPKEAAEKYLAEEQRLATPGGPDSLKTTYAGKKRRRILISKTPIKSRSGQIVGILGVSTSPTEEDQRMLELWQSEAEFRRVWEHSFDSMRLVAEDGTMLMVNDAFCRLVGKSRDELVGHHFATIYETSEQPEVTARHHERFTSHDMEQLYEREHVLWNGERVWFELSSSFIEVEGQSPQLLSIFRDVTERRQAADKLRDFTARLERSNRELQDFAYVASHDLQEPLRKITVFGDRLQNRFASALSNEAHDYLDRMLNAGRRMQTLINDLLNFSRVTSKAQPFVPVDLNLAAREVLSDLEARIEQAGAVVEIGSLPTIDAEPLQMRQLLQNLIGNALKFHKPDVKPAIKIDAHKIKPPQGTARTMVELTVSDNGIGFEEKYSSRIFQVFQRLHTRDVYEGTGMGLAIARKIAEHHGGTIRATSALGEGSTFIVTLPLKIISK